MNSPISGKQLKEWRESAGLTQEELGQRLGYTREWIGKLESNDRPISANIHLKLETLKRELEFTNRGELRENPAPYGVGHPLRDLAPREIPVISWAHAGEAVSYEEIPRDWQNTIYTSCATPHAFAITVEGDSMLPDFRPGDVVVVMPEVEPRNHCPVVAKLKNDGVVLKILNASGPEKRTIVLTSINPVYQPLTYTPEDFHWIWPVHSSQRLHWR